MWSYALLVIIWFCEYVVGVDCYVAGFAVVVVVGIVGMCVCVVAYGVVHYGVVIGC